MTAPRPRSSLNLLRKYRATPRPKRPRKRRKYYSDNYWDITFGLLCCLGGLVAFILHCVGVLK